MVDKDAIEKALLIGIVREKNWELLILNNIDKDYFQAANQLIYDYIKGFVDNDSYPELPVLAYKFQIDDISMSEYSQITDLPALCNILKEEYIRQKLSAELNALNNYSDELQTDANKFIERIRYSIFRY